MCEFLFSSVGCIVFLVCVCVCAFLGGTGCVCLEMQVSKFVQHWRGSRLKHS